MRNVKLMLAAAVSVAALSGTAQAATIVGATVTGPSGTVWTTDANNFYALFLQGNNTSTYINPNRSISLPVMTSGNMSQLLVGEGFRAGETINSDATFNLALRFAGGQTLSGIYTVATNSFLGGANNTFTEGSTTYSLTNFFYNRGRADLVSGYTATPGGDPLDYNGSFTVSAVTSAVPETATWAMMLAGFAMIGAGVRSRKNQSVRVTYA